MHSGIVGTIPLLLEKKAAFAELLATAEGAQGFVLPLLLISLAMYAVYGATLGMTSGFEQSVAAAAKLPAMFALTMALCLPVLHVGAVLAGARLALAQTAALLLFAMATHSAILASCAPVTGFYAMGARYDFMKLLHVGVVGLSAAYSLRLLHAALDVLARSGDILPEGSRAVFLLWMGVYGFVGTQMAWTLRPFIGEPGLPFQWLRPRSGGSFWEAIAQSVGRIMSRFRPQAMEW